MSERALPAASSELSSPEPEYPSGYRIRHELSDGVHLTMLVWNMDEQRWFLEHRAVSHDAERRADFVCDTKAIVSYLKGHLRDEFTLTLHVVLPQRLGQKFFLGVDISPGAKTYVEFTYRRTGVNQPFRLIMGQIGARTEQRFDDDEDTQALARLVELPFPVPADIPCDFGRYKVPFLHTDGTIAYMEFRQRFEAA